MADTQVITIYGSDIDITSTEYPEKSVVEALNPAPVSKQFNAPWTRGGVKFTDDVKEYLNGFISGHKTLRLTWEPESEILDMPASKNSIVDFFGLDVLQKKYKWLYIPEYTIVPPDLLTGDKCIAVQLVGGMEIGFGFKDRKFKLKLAKRSLGT